VHGGFPRPVKVHYIIIYTYTFIYMHIHICIYLCVHAVIDNDIFCVHGGFPRPVKVHYITIHTPLYIHILYKCFMRARRITSRPVKVHHNYTHIYYFQMYVMKWQAR
jgi:hypothetical protein